MIIYLVKNELIMAKRAAEYMGLPVYRADINMDDDTGMLMISLVDRPAVERNFVAFSKERMTYSIGDEEKRMVFGVVMLADTLIYRRDGDFEYWIEYDRPTIEKMAEKYFRMGYQNNVDTDHNLKLEDGIYLTQMFIKDSAKGISPEGFDDVRDGSLFGQFHVENDDVWESIKKGDYKGFSLYGIFDVSPCEQEYKSNKRKDKMSKITRIKEMLKRILTQFGSVSTDKGIIVWDGDDDLKEGYAVQVYNPDDDSYAKPEDGDYKTDDGKTITVEDGKATKITDERAEVSPEEDNPAEESFKAMKQKYELTYDEKYMKIVDAIREKGLYSEFYIIEASDTYAVVETWDAENTESKKYKHDLSWNGDEVTVGDGVEVKNKYVPVDEKKEETVEEDVTVTEEKMEEEVPNPDNEGGESDTKAIEELRKEVNELYKVIDELTKRVDELEKKPAAESATEEFKKAYSYKDTGDAKIDRLNRIMSAGK